MAVGDDDDINLFGRDSILFHLAKNFWQMAGMAWIDENGHALIDHKGVTIVIILVLPRIGI
jgi:hypothetical protein